MRKSVEYYARDLPEGVTIKPIFATRTYQLRKGPVLLDEKHEEEVLMWMNPRRVFAYCARRALREQAAEPAAEKEE